MHRKEGGQLATQPLKTPFLNFFNGDYRPTPPPALPAYPAGGDPSPQRTRTACTAQAAAQTVPEPGRASTRANNARHDTRPDAGRAAPVCTRCQTGRAGGDRTGCGALDCPRSVSETEQMRTLEQYAKTGLKIITILCMFVACATLQIH